MKRILATLLLLTAACAPEAPPPPATTQPAAPPLLPSAAAARALIAESAELGEHKFTDAGWSVVVAGSAMNDASRQAAKDLAAAGWIAFDGAGDIQLTEKSRNDKRFILRPNGLLDIVPLAKKEMGDVEGVRPGPDNTALATFAWRWIPNEVGSSFKSGLLADRFTAPQRSTATLMWDGSAWVVLKIE